MLDKPLQLETNFSNDFSKHSRNSLYYPHQMTLEPCFPTISVFRWNYCGLSNCLCGQQGQTSKQTCVELKQWKETFANTVKILSK